MTSTDFPSRAKPEALHALCRHLRSVDGAQKTDLYSEIDIDQRQIRAAVDYGAKLGFLTIEDDFVQNTSRGSGLGYAGNIDSDSAQTVFREAIESYEPYRDTLVRLYAAESVEEVNGNPAIKQKSFKAKAEASTGEEPSDREINLLIKTAQAAGLGKFVTGRKGFETRLKVSEQYEEFLSELTEKYPIPEPEATIDDETEGAIEEENNNSTNIDEIVLKADQSAESLKLKVEYDVTNKSENQIIRLVQHIRGGE